MRLIVQLRRKDASGTALAEQGQDAVIVRSCPRRCASAAGRARFCYFAKCGAGRLYRVTIFGRVLLHSFYAYGPESSPRPRRILSGLPIKNSFQNPLTAPDFAFILPVLYAYVLAHTNVAQTEKQEAKMTLKRKWLKPETLERISRNPRLADRPKTMGGKPAIGGTRPIQEMREALGLTQAQLAEATGLRRTMIANLESERYAAIIWVGIKMYLALASIAAKKQLTPLYEEAKKDVQRFIDFQRDLNARTIRNAEREAENKRRKVKSLEKRLADEEARLREL